jgi:hypothetical protein
MVDPSIRAGHRPTLSGGSVPGSGDGQSRDRSAVQPGTGPRRARPYLAGQLRRIARIDA